MSRVHKEVNEEEVVRSETIELQSEHLGRSVRVDFFQPDNKDAGPEMNLLLMNDGQDLIKINFGDTLKKVSIEKNLKPLLVAGIHCGPDRNQEYGMSVAPNCNGWGSKAASYELFVKEELLPFIRSRFHYLTFSEISFAGFSLGALSALDIAWNNPHIFSKCGVFSGSLWWRSVDQMDKNYDPWQHRMMHRQVMNSEFRPGMKFFLQCGEQDEMEDRNKNGVIDSIDDTIDLMRVFLKKGYREGTDFYYLQLREGKHDIASWAKALPYFLKWGWGIRS
jgi:enterochelin esterase-like enzyme